MKKILRNIIGTLFLSVGVVGGFIPILQGWVFVLTGFILIDFKKKKDVEQKILDILSKTRLGKKLADLWIRVKSKNKDVIENESTENVRTIYHDIDKDIKK